MPFGWLFRRADTSGKDKLPLMTIQGPGKSDESRIVQPR